jgi:UDP-galactopyranose mutase
MSEINYDFLIVGAGLSGITVAEKLSKDRKLNILIVDKRNHIGGNVYDYYNPDGVLIHKYGPHIFHTSNEKVYKYLSTFTQWTPYRHKVVASVNNKFLPIPINRDTINGFFDISLRDESDVKAFLDTKKDKSITKIKNSHDVIVSKYGKELYDNFIKNYTKKQWDLYPEELDKSVLERIPIRYDSDPYYFNDKYQGLPKEGYTVMIDKMIDKDNIKVALNTNYKDIMDKVNFKNIIVTSPIDEFFDYSFGKLRYRAVEFIFETYDKKSYQDNCVINYPNEHKYTRITEFTKMTLQDIDKTTICKEIPTWEGEKTYPVPSEKDNKILSQYQEQADKLKNVFFLGRLGQYKYINMDQAVNNALEFYIELKNKI